MSLKSIIHSLFHSTQAQSAVAAIKAAPIGGEIASAINAASATDKAVPRR